MTMVVVKRQVKGFQDMFVATVKPSGVVVFSGNGREG